MNYTVSGSAGSWVYDFSVTNNLGGDNLVYLFGVNLGAVTTDGITGSTGLWHDISPQNYTTPTTPYGASSIYYNVWRNLNANFSDAISSGQTLSGFKVSDASQTPYASVAWFVFETSLSGNASSATGCVYCNGSDNLLAPQTQSGFEGTASATPLPSTWLMLLSGFVGLGFFAYRGAKKNSVALAA